MDTHLLEKVGFTKGEIKVYLALIELGETTTGPIIEKSKITGSKVYEILKKLSSKGLVSQIVKQKTKYFQASSPKRLLDYLEKMEDEFKSQKESIEKIIPSLELLQKSKNEFQNAQMFEGYGGVKTVFNLILELLNENEEYYAFSLGDELKNERVMIFLQNYHQKRIERKIKVKIIASKGEELLFKDLSKLKGLEIKFQSRSFPLSVFIFKDYVATFNFSGNPVCFLIKSNKIASSYKEFFVNLWKK